MNEHGRDGSDEAEELDDADGREGEDGHGGRGDDEDARNDRGGTDDGDSDGHSHDDHTDHDHHSHDIETLGVGVITVSSSRSIDEDEAGDAIVSALEDEGHQVTVRELVADDFDGIQSTVNRIVGRDDVDAVVTSGGTGVTPDDVTVEAVDDIVAKSLPGFGELFRRLSYDEIGTRVVGTRATGGLIEHTPVFCLPGSENAARLGVEEILVPELPHIAGLAHRE